MKLPRDLDGGDLVAVLCRDWMNAILRAVAQHKGERREDVLTTV